MSTSGFWFDIHLLRAQFHTKNPDVYVFYAFVEILQGVTFFTVLFMKYKGNFTWNSHGIEYDNFVIVIRYENSHHISNAADALHVSSFNRLKLYIQRLYCSNHIYSVYITY